MNVAKIKIQAQFVLCELGWNHVARATMVFRKLYYVVLT